jgi:hypothetical protein
VEVEVRGVRRMELGWGLGGGLKVLKVRVKERVGDAALLGGAQETDTTAANAAANANGDISSSIECSSIECGSIECCAVLGVPLGHPRQPGRHANPRSPRGVAGVRVQAGVELQRPILGQDAQI